MLDLIPLAAQCRLLFCNLVPVAGIVFFQFIELGLGAGDIIPETGSILL